MHYNQDEHLMFLKHKINEIKIALFKSEMNSELQIPNNIIETLCVEDDGTVWFFTTCNGKHARFINKSFHASLNYYKKSTGSYLHLSGKAIIVNDHAENPFPMLNDCSNELYTSVLIKMKIMQADFFENRTSTDVSGVEKIKALIAGLFLSPPHRVYNFS